MSPDEQRLFRLYGKLPNRKDVVQNKLKERKYFDSGDYALSKAGKASDAGVTQIGREHPNPESIPHLSSSPHAGSLPNGAVAGATDSPGLQARSAVSGASVSPVKESSFLQQQTSIDDQPDEDEEAANTSAADVEEEKLARKISPPPAAKGMPIREQH